MRTRLFVGTLVLALLLPLSWLIAGLPQFAAEEIAIGDSPHATAVTPDDRIVATLLGTDTVTVSWIDTADFASGPFTLGLDGESAAAIEGGTLDGDPVVFVGGSQVDVVRFDVAGIPAAGTDEAIGLGLDGGALVDLAWDATTLLLYGADSAGGSLRRVDFSGEDASVDGTGWPVELGFTPVRVEQLDSSLLLVIGTAAIAVVDVTSMESPTLELLALELPDSDAIDLATDGVDTAWIIFENSQIWELERYGSDGAGDDDDSAGDDDDSAGDDDDSSGDDDDSATDEERGDLPENWTLELFITEPGTPGVGIAYVEVEDEGYVHVAGGNQVTVCNLSASLLERFDLSSDATSLAASSGDDGFVYVPQAGNHQLAILGAGPFVRIDTVDPTEIDEVDETISVTFSVDFGGQASEVCDYRFEVDATIAGGGTEIESAVGTATDGESITVELSGAELPSGDHTVFIFCADSDGDDGRASFSYSSAGLSAPSGFTLTADDGQVALSWDHDGTADVYVVYFDTEDFDEDAVPTTCNNDNTICSEHLEVPGGSTGDDDDSSTDDDDDDDTDSVSLTVDQLTNGTRYYFAIAARSAEEVEGPRTSTRSAVPSRRGGAAVLAGDTGGCSCSSSITSASSASLGALLLLLFGFARRRNER